MHCSTHALQHTLGADGMLLWICTQTCKSGAGMGTTLKWMLARASGQGDYTPLHPVSEMSYKGLFKGVKQSTNPSIFPCCLALRRAARRMDRERLIVTSDLKLQVNLPL